MFNPPIQEQPVKVFLPAGLFKREDALDDYKEDDTQREQVNLRPLVSFALLDLGRHIRHRSSIGLQCIDVLVTGEAVVGHLQVELLINKDVFKFYVTMNNTFVVHVFKGVEELRDEKPASVFAHRSHRLA